MTKINIMHALQILIVLIGIGAYSLEANAAPATVTPVAAPNDLLPEAHPAFVARAQAGNVDFLFFGDSITRRWATDGLPVWNESFAPLGAVNFGVGSDKTQNVLWRIQNGELSGISPKLIVLMIGTNNLNSDSAADIGLGVQAIINEIKARSPSSKILLLSVLTPNYAGGATQANNVNNYISSYANGTSIVYLNIGYKFYSANGVILPGVYTDALHLSEAGYRIWRDAMLPTVNTMLGITPDTTAPSIPANLNGTAASSSQVNLTWTAATDAGGSGVAGYKVYRNGVYVTSVTGTSYNHTGLAADTSYNFTVASYDGAGNNSVQSAIKTIKTLAGGVTPTCPTRANANIYVAANDFSGVQGCNQWSYRDSKGVTLTYNSTAKNWKGSETYLLIWAGHAHPGNSADVVRRWTAHAAGSITITGNALDGDGAGGDGVNVSIRKGTTILWQSNLINGSTIPVVYNVTTAVAAGEAIDFVVNRLANYSNDTTAFNPTITFTAGGTPTNLPDVVVTAVNYANGVFTATVKNQGTAATPAGVIIGVGYTVDGTYRTYGTTTTSIAAGASVNIGTTGGNYVIPNGTHTILANADDAQRFAESNESNNTLSKTITVGTPVLVAPTILSLAYGTVVINNLNKVTISWGAVSGATGYAVRMRDNQDGTIRDSRNSSGCTYVCIDNYQGTSITVNVRTGHTYTFWIHSRAGTGSYPGPSWSDPNGTNFSYTFQ